MNFIYLHIFRSNTLVIEKFKSHKLWKIWIKKMYDRDRRSFAGHFINAVYDNYNIIHRLQKPIRFRAK
jgi:hypothetical protein